MSLNFSDIDLIETNRQIPEHAGKEIAIIGMSGKFGASESLKEYWDNLCLGNDGIHSFPKNRIEDISPYLTAVMPGANESQFFDKAYLNAIDTFDYQFFKMSPKEASLMDPNQRLFLETAWSAIEDAGYGGNRLASSNTGVFAGFCTMTTNNYLNYIETMNPDLLAMAAPGNITSIIASRLSYLLDLKGPSLVVDTACSSSLVAVHLACQSILNGDCEMALAGGVKAGILPGLHNENEDIGIRSSDDRTKTFDHNSNGTGGGEGVAAILLKSLPQALEDGDTIYGVIKGSAVNQDGKSVGITAPNSQAQEDVILKAWGRAEIDPETISFIEAHGTGTPLGDPVEIAGIQNAFEHFTSKRQFCAVGSVKSNIGHLDGAAGIAGLIKAVLALKNKKIPPSIHFKYPNKKIPFIDSPVFVNDRLLEWKDSPHPRRCGISSFGLSGTNCHIVLEEAPVQPTAEQKEHADLFTLSAMNEDGLSRLIRDYTALLEKQQVLDLNQICFTANTGRHHHSCRLAVIAKNTEELKTKLLLLQKPIKSIPERGIWCSSDSSSIPSAQIPAAGIDPVLYSLAEAYSSGKEIDWESRYKDPYKKINLPAYPFTPSRCWLENRTPVISRNLEQKIHPLIDRVAVRSKDLVVYETVFSVKNHWELREHVLNGNHLLPGTAYIEIAQIAGKHALKADFVELNNVLFVSPFVLGQDEEKNVQIVLRISETTASFSINSYNEELEIWETHAEGNIQTAQKLPEKNRTDLQTVKEEAENHLELNDEMLKEATVQVGQRWRNINHLYIHPDKVLAHLTLSEEFREEAACYFMYPSLLDGAVNAANGTAGSEHDVYLPLWYKKFRIFRSIPISFYSLLTRKDHQEGDKEVATFDIELIDEDGGVFGEIEGYAIKKMRHAELVSPAVQTDKDLYHTVQWMPDVLPLPKSEVGEKDCYVIIHGKNGRLKDLAAILNKKGARVINVLSGETYCKFSPETYRISGTQEDYQMLVKELETESISRIIHLGSMDFDVIENADMLDKALTHGVRSLFYLTQQLIQNKLRTPIELVIITNYAGEVTHTEEYIKPQNSALIGFSRSIQYEHENLHVRVIDTDNEITSNELLSEIGKSDSAFLTAYRNHQRFTESLTESSRPAVAEGIHLKPEGVYIITGGTGGVGLTTAEHLSSAGAGHLALLNRSDFPDKKEWMNSGRDDQTHSKIKQLQVIESQGATIDLCRTDITDKEQLNETLQLLKAKYGRINGVIHNAGIAGDGFIMTKETSTFEEVLAPKIKGTWLLHELTEQDQLDFFILSSSFVTAFGAPGQSDYCAANAYQDAFAAYRNKTHSGTLTFNWSGWAEAGMVLNHQVDLTKNLLDPISNEAGITAFQAFAGGSISRVLVGRFNYEQLKKNTDYLSIALSSRTMKKLNQLKKAEPENNSAPAVEIVLTGKADFTLIEMKVAKAWSHVLGLYEFDMGDKFFEAGGDSLLSIHLLKELEKDFPSVLDITDVFTYSTIQEMADFIDDSLQEPIGLEEDTSDEDLDAILKKLAEGKIAASDAGKLI
ncbi:SDR family NAD(P)-dependent oxidoreductase [Viridibacillus sp. YIM B01967]|uniref:SDR family NAD(P)-dependent oxidoreductase n=1 Tax=Viridibacillus soli TaxID=2798301 RepID=A0ABS1H5Q2_9BACL|nr:SDR family NAD(P)-dependent oxidoreductase [Viridibacillus soli]MBK3494740.1 SDR family NAD(P)-dependent oxidoreductase [Viridibacillus soli]